MSGSSDSSVGNAAALSLLQALPFPTNAAQVKNALGVSNQSKLRVLARGYFANIFSEDISKNALPQGSTGISPFMAAPEFMVAYFPNRWGVGVFYEGPGALVTDFQTSDDPSSMNAYLDRFSGFGLKGMYEFARALNVSIFALQAGLQIEDVTAKAYHSDMTTALDWKGVGIRPELEANMQGTHFQLGIYAGVQYDKLWSTSGGRTTNFVYVPIGADLGLLF